jgi:PAS domain S-box-containing protein
MPNDDAPLPTSTPSDDVSALRRRVAELEDQLTAAQKAAAALRTFCDSTPLRMGLVELCDNDIILAWGNEAFARFYGLRRDQVPGVSASRLGISPTYLAAWLAGYRQALATGQPVSREIHDPRSGSWGLATVAPVLGPRDGPQRFCFVVADITSRKRAEEERLLVERRLQEAHKLESLAALAGGVAHVFNNLLVAIMGNASLVERSLPPDVQGREELAQIHSASEQAASLCRQMRDYAGRGRFSTGLVDLDRLVRDMIDLLRLSVSKKAELRCDLAGSLPPILTDATQIRQVVMDLVVNASEALGEQGGQIRIRSGVRPAEPGSQALVYLEVEDNGCGMDEATRAFIFDPFFSTKFTGRGLGLAAVQGIVRSHKGRIEVESEPGRGSTFRVLLPAAEGPLPQQRRTARVTEDGLGGGTILVVDDETWVRDVTARMLGMMGFDVLQARDGEEALARFREAGEVRLVLLDLTMPRLDGEETFRTLHLLAPAVPVILMSGYSEQEAASRFVGKGLAGFLAKPFRLDDLAAKVRAALQKDEG